MAGSRSLYFLYIYTFDTIITYQEENQLVKNHPTYSSGTYDAILKNIMKEKTFGVFLTFLHLYVKQNPQ